MGYVKTQDQRYRTLYELDDDAVKGFRQAVSNNQVTLALEYLRNLLDTLAIPDETEDDSPLLRSLFDKVAVLEARLDELENKKAAPARGRKVEIEDAP